MPLRSVNPATGAVVREYEAMSSAAVVALVEHAHDAFRAWREEPFANRARRMRQAADTLREQREAHAALITLEMGKPIRQSRAEVDKCAWVCDYYAENADRFLAVERTESDAPDSYVAFEPLGVVFAIMPWNFPYWQVFRFAAPALMAGNACLLKHAPSVCGCARAIERLLVEAGFPIGLFRSLFIDEREVESEARRIIRHPRVRAVSLTGSVRAGRSVARVAGEALKKTVLELGGSDPYVILADADVEAAAERCAASRLINSGQSCIAAKRLIVVESRRDEFEERLLEHLRAAKVGDPTDESTEVGPLARLDLRDTLDRQVRKSVDAGARCRLGGAVPEGAGAFYPVTLLTEVHAGMPAFEEELFGPVAAVVPARDEAEALALANASEYGLAAAVFTADRERGEHIAREELEAGVAFVNELVRSDPRLPFGGVKDSGYGRELGTFGIREFVNIKTVAIY